MFLLLNSFKKFFAILVVVIGFGWLMKKQGADKERLKQHETASKIMARQRDVNINSVDDADKLFKDIEDRN